MKAVIGVVEAVLGSDIGKPRGLTTVISPPYTSYRRSLPEIRSPSTHTKIRRHTPVTVKSSKRCALWAAARVKCTVICSTHLDDRDRVGKSREKVEKVAPPRVSDLYVVPITRKRRPTSLVLEIHVIQPYACTRFPMLAPIHQERKVILTRACVSLLLPLPPSPPAHSFPSTSHRSLRGEQLWQTCKS